MRLPCPQPGLARVAQFYDGHHQKRLTFSKRYEDICTEWLGGLAARPYQSLIERDQLGPHLRALVAAKFLGSYTIAKGQGGRGFVISFRPGELFFSDYNRFYRNRERGNIHFDFHADRKHVAEPLKVAYLFVEKRTRRPAAGIPYVPSKAVETAKYLLRQLSFENIPEFLDYALARAKKIHFPGEAFRATLVLRGHLHLFDVREDGPLGRPSAERLALTRRMFEVGEGSWFCELRKVYHFPKQDKWRVFTLRAGRTHRRIRIACRTGRRAQRP